MLAKYMATMFTRPKNEVIYTPSTMAEWTVAGTGSTKGSGSIHLVQTAADDFARIAVSCKNNSNYGLLYIVAATNLNSDFAISLAGFTNPATVVLPKAVGNNKAVVTTANPITNNVLGFVCTSGNTNGTYIDFNSIRLIELPVGSQIEADFAALTADQLNAKYPF